MINSHKEYHKNKFSLAFADGVGFHLIKASDLFRISQSNNV